MSLKIPGAFLFSLLVVISVTGQGIPPGAATTETGLGGINSITGMVITSTGQRITRPVSIRLRTMTRGDRISTTDDKGNFAFRDVPPGDYTVIIDKETDFEPFTQSVSIIQPRGMPPQNYYLSVRLIRKGTITKTGVVNVDLAKVPKAARDLYNKAIELGNSGDSTGAIKQLEAAIAEYHDFMLAYNAMGVAYLQLNELEKADQALQSALKIDPVAYMPMLNRGIVLFTMKRYGEAAPVLRKFIELKNDEARGHYFLGQTLANMGRFDEAEKELQTSVKLGGDGMKEAHRYLAILYSSKNETKRAAEELETYLRLAPTTPDADQLRAVLAKLKGQEPQTPPPTPAPSPAKPPQAKP